MLKADTTGYPTTTVWNKSRIKSFNSVRKTCLYILIWLSCAKKESRDDSVDREPDYWLDYCNRHHF